MSVLSQHQREPQRAPACWDVIRLDLSQCMALNRKIERLFSEFIWQQRALFTLDLYPMEVTEHVMGASTEQALQILQELMDKETFLPGEVRPLIECDSKAQHAPMNEMIAGSSHGGAHGIIDSSKAGTDKAGPLEPNGQSTSAAGRDGWGRPYRIDHFNVKMFPGSFDAMFTCPITQDLMHEPVVAADGYSYEKSAIEKWLLTHDKSPMTNLQLQHKNLVPNHALRFGIRDYRGANGLL